MTRRPLLLLAWLAVVATLLGHGATAAPPPCRSTPERHALRIPSGSTPGGDLLMRLSEPEPTRYSGPGEVAGKQTFSQGLSNGWEFALIPNRHGWSIRLYDQAAGGADKTRADLSVVTPPLSGAVPNPRDVLGWHFRNRDNTGPNTGEVNAPQHLRLFQFEPALAGTGGSPPPAGQAVLDAPGRGWLHIHDLGLADLEPGGRARAAYLQFEACLTWPNDEPAGASTEHTDGDREIFGACGLDLTQLRLHSLVAPAVLGIDIDGDGSHDHLSPFKETGNTETRSIALCRAGTWLHRLDDAEVVTLESGDRADWLHVLGSLEYWRVVPADFAAVDTPLGETTWPPADGDVLVLERREKAMYLLFSREGSLRARRVFRHVEP